MLIFESESPLILEDATIPHRDLVGRIGQRNPECPARVPACSILDQRLLRQLAPVELPLEGGRVLLEQIDQGTPGLLRRQRAFPAPRQASRRSQPRSPGTRTNRLPAASSTSRGSTPVTVRISFRACTRGPRREVCRVLFEHRGGAGARDSVLKEHPTNLRPGCCCRVLFEHRGGAGARDSVLKEHPTNLRPGCSDTLFNSAGASRSHPSGHPRPPVRRARPGAGLVAALGIGDLGADVAGGVVAIGRHGDEEVGRIFWAASWYSTNSSPGRCSTRALPSRRQVTSIVSPDRQRRSQTSSRAASPRSRAGFDESLMRAISRCSSRCGATGRATGIDVQPRSAAVIGVFAVASQALAIPAATRSARTWRFSCEPSLYLPAPMLPPAPSKWMCGTPVACCRCSRANPGKSGLARPVR